MRPACNRDPPAPSPRSKCSTSFAATRTHMGDHETRPTCHQVARLFGCWTAAPHASSVKAGPTEPQFRLWRTDPCSVGADVIRERLRLRGRESPLLRHSFRRIPTTRMPDGGGSLRAGRVGRGRREAIARRMPPGSSGSACASPGPSSHRPAPARRLRPWQSNRAARNRGADECDSLGRPMPDAHIAASRVAAVAHRTPRRLCTRAMPSADGGSPRRLGSGRFPRQRLRL